MPDIFISYSRKDSASVEQLAEMLASAGLSCWIDKQGIDLATSWSGEIVDAIEQCRAFIVMLSSNSVSSHNVAKEVALASEQRKKILPLDLEQVELSRELKYHLAGIQRTSSANIDTIIRVLSSLGLEATGTPLPPKIVRDTSGKKSLMILPFEDFSPTGDNQWFTDGMASELILSLSHVKSLRVIDWNTSKLFRERKVKTVDLARELEVRYFLEGQVRKFGDQIKISLTLLDIETGDHVWQDSIKGTMDDVFDIQETVAKKVVDALKVHLATEEEKKLHERGTENTEAYELYLKADQYQSLQTREGYFLALGQLSHAIELDSKYVQAMRFKSYILTELYRLYERNPEHLVEAEHLAKQALEIQPELAGPYQSLASIYRMQGRLEEAEAAAKESIHRDPKLGASHFALGFFYDETDQPARAIPPYEETLALEPESLPTYMNLVVVCHRAGDMERVQRWARASFSRFEKRLRLVPNDEHAVVAFATMLEYAGEQERAIAILAPMLIKPNLDGVSLYNIACIYLRLGEKEKALSALRSCIRTGFSNVELFDRDPDLDPLRGTPQFDELLKEVREIHG